MPPFLLLAFPVDPLHHRPNRSKSTLVACHWDWGVCLSHVTLKPVPWGCVCSCLDRCPTVWDQSWLWLWRLGESHRSAPVLQNCLLPQYWSPTPHSHTPGDRTRDRALKIWWWKQKKNKTPEITPPLDLKWFQLSVHPLNLLEWGTSLLTYTRKSLFYTHTQARQCLDDTSSSRITQAASVAAAVSPVDTLSTRLNNMERNQRGEGGRKGGKEGSFIPLVVGTCCKQVSKMYPKYTTRNLSVSTKCGSFNSCRELPVVASH